MITERRTKSNDADFDAIKLAALVIAERLRRGYIDADGANLQLLELIRQTRNTGKQPEANHEG